MTNFSNILKGTLVILEFQIGCQSKEVAPGVAPHICMVLHGSDWVVCLD